MVEKDNISSHCAQERGCESSPEQHSPKGGARWESGAAGSDRNTYGGTAGRARGRGLGNVLGDKLQKGDEAD